MTLDDMSQSLQRIETLLHGNTTLPVDMTQTEAAKILRVSRWTVARYVTQGLLKTNRRKRITAASGRALLS